MNSDPAAEAREQIKYAVEAAQTLPMAFVSKPHLREIIYLNSF
jgi:hypothetical protein